MRPEILFPLFAAISSLPGIGKRLTPLVEKIAGKHIVDLCWLLPVNIIDRRYRPKISAAPEGAIATLDVYVLAHKLERKPYRVVCSDDTGTMDVVYFHGGAEHIKKILPVDSRRYISGRTAIWNNRLQIAHPDHVLTEEEFAAMSPVEPVYPLTAGLTVRPLRKAVDAALHRAPDLPEWQDPAWIKQQQWPAWQSALQKAHAPENDTDLAPDSPHRSRLAYDELLASQLALTLTRRHLSRRAGRALTADGALCKAVRDALPYSLTADQKTVLSEIHADLARGDAMLRLLQGDVGSGKTIVALMAMLSAVECGAQAALMAPTELLARQHFDVLQPLLSAAGVKAAILTGREKGPRRDQLLADLAADGPDGISILIGTHALFQSDVEFRDLALAVVDEQHRFGVHQKLRLFEKSQSAVHVLVMTATPIPRTLALTAYGDMDVSRLMEKPPGRQPVTTKMLSLDRLDDVIRRLRRAVENGGRAYWICPMVEESQVLDLAAAVERHADLQKIFGAQKNKMGVGLIHGRMKPPEKDAAMNAFMTGDVPVLVATSVVEVGVDVPDATIMIIEHAERFGLAQLHQLRGRVGRGETPSSCLLLYKEPLTSTVEERLGVLCDSNDGFHIAEEDLRLRGAGEVLGTRQSGMPDFRLADLAAHADLLAAARDDARMIADKDPKLSSPRGEALRTLLYLFERDEAVRYPRSG